MEGKTGEGREGHEWVGTRERRKGEGRDGKVKRGLREGVGGRGREGREMGGKAGLGYFYRGLRVPSYATDHV